VTIVPIPDSSLVYSVSGFNAQLALGIHIIDVDDGVPLTVSFANHIA